MASNILDDVWQSDNDEESPEIPFDLKKLREEHMKRGYLDGVTDSKDKNLQEGFDSAFPTGALLGQQIGRYLGILQVLAMKYGKEDLSLCEDLAMAKKELRIQKVLTKSMFDPEFNLQGEHTLIEKWKQIVKAHCTTYSVNTNL